MTNVRSRFNDWMFKVLLFLVPFLFVPLLCGRVSAADLSEAKDIVLSSESFVYNGATQTPTLTSLNDKDGKAITISEVKISFEDANGAPVTSPINAGTYTVVIEDSGGGSHTSQNKTKTFTITPKTLTDTSITVDPISDVTYDGTEKEPSVVVKDGNTTLTNGVDYTVSYSNSTNVGTATATITGAGNYTGNIDKTFNITAKSLTDTSITVDPIADVTYDGTEKKPSVVVKDGNKTLTNGVDYTVSYSNSTNVGTATATITGTGNYTGNIDKTFTITAKSLTDTSITVVPIADVTYDGTAKKPPVVVKDGNTMLANDVDYTVSYSNNTNVGTATVTISSKGNNITGTTVKTFKITPASVNFSDLNASNIVYGQSLSESKITGKGLDSNGKEIEGTFSFVNPLFVPEQADKANPQDMTANAEIIFTSNDGNYEGTGIVPVKVKYWGEPILNNGTMNWVDSNSTTSVQVKESGISWLKEDSDNSFTWYGIENPLNAAGQPLFEPGSRFWVRWLNKNDSDWDKYYGQIDDKYKSDVDSGKLWVFLTGVTSPDGTEYKNFGTTANLYIQLGSDWDERDLRAMCILSGDDEKVTVSYVTSSSIADCPINGKLAKLSLTHFSAFGLYDSLGLDDYLPSLTTTKSGTSSASTSSKGTSSSGTTSSSGLSSLYKATGETDYQNEYLIPMFLPILLFVLIYEKKRLNKVL